MTKERQINKKRQGNIRNHASIDIDILCECIDSLTGESGVGRRLLHEEGVLQDGVPVQHQRRKKDIYVKENYSSTTHFVHHFLALDPDLTGQAVKVFHYVCSILEMGNWALVSPTEISAKMNIDRTNVSKALQLLEKKGLLIRGEKHGRHYFWRLNPEAAWMGRASERWETVEHLQPSPFIEKKVEYAEERGYEFKWLRFVREVDDTGEIPHLGLRPRSVQQRRDEQQANYRDYHKRQNDYHRELRIKLYGQEYADDIDWKKLTEEERAKLQLRRAKVESEMKESGEWESLQNKYFPPEGKEKATVIDFEEKKKRQQEAQELVRELVSSDVDLEQLREFLKKNGTK